ncbi:universal stress protein [Salinicola rhizosphaerae]|uniref:UspA domain-containing protein n=1 Tax=Salinicola rhizosphaerae TaxID=1443141 RepID=A0ABQ3EDC7_9GAMM|nr:universal stress protein [Salinicola rhizosphaerae]GHB34199.1 hypothetical protein GCM10009038_36590 [Salinicola rhizosphaerae]
MTAAILVAVSEGESSMAALKKARSIVQREHYRLYLLHVIESRESRNSLERATGASPLALDQRDIASAERLLRDRWEALNAPMAEVDNIICGGNVEEAIVREARKRDATIVIMGQGSQRSRVMEKTATLAERVERSLACELVVVDIEGNVT